MGSMTCLRWLMLGVLVVLAEFGVVRAAQAADAARVAVYPQSAALEQSADYVVKVRVPGGKWEQAAVYAIPVSTGIDVEADVRAGAAQNLGGSRSALTSMSSFDFTGTVEVEVSCLHSAPTSVRIRPENDKVIAALEGRTIRFTLDHPHNLSIELDADIFHNLQLFAGAIPATEPGAGDAHTLYYGPGIHWIGTVEVPSGTTVYLAGGAVVIGGFSVVHAHDVRIGGRGILASPRVVPQAVMRNRPLEPAVAVGTAQRRHDAILIEYSKHVDLDGIIVVSGGYTVLTGQSEQVTIRAIKSFSAGGNNDGIDIFTSQHILIDGVFMRNSDDTIALYGHRWSYYGDLTDVTVENSTLWADVAHPIVVGTHGDTDHPETLSALHFKNLDILDHREPQIDYQGCMSLNAGDGNLIKDVFFENIRVDDFRMGQLLNLRVMFNRKYNTSPGRGIENVLFRNVSYTGSHATVSMIAGYDDQRMVKHVVFEGLRMNGIVVSDAMKGKPGFYKTADIAYIFIGEHVDDVQFNATAR